MCYFISLVNQVMTYLAEIEEEVGDGKLDLSLLDGGRLGVSVLLGDSDQDLVISETRVVELSTLVSLVSSRSTSPASLPLGPRRAA